ncbi:MAG: glutamate-1-semialdehyde 2,1-aminomutase [Nitrospirae bacterium]|nr:glutamate-1-semialdehyde 2,1-aminomutase [Nitrospirota bacterium]
MQSNSQLFSQARKHIPGGVNSPVRAFQAVGGTPLFIDRAKGSKLYSAEGKEYLDYCLSWGALILGHSCPGVIVEVKKALEKGTSFGAPTRMETELARKACEAVPSMELVRLVNSGTEAVMSAIRVARGYTGRNKIIKFAGSYHGHADYLLVEAGSGAMTLNVGTGDAAGGRESQSLPSSLGVPEDFTKHTFVLPYNNLKAVEETVKKHAADIACIIVEPVSGNMGVIPPQEGFLEGLRRTCDRHDVILIFDEVITGFRLAYGGAQELFSLKADLTCLGKIMGGGFPLAAYGGRKDIMECVSPLGNVYQAGTLSGNPVATTAGLATLNLLSSQKEELYKSLAEKAGYLYAEIKKEAEKSGVEMQIHRVGSMLSLFFTSRPVSDYETAKATDTVAYRKFFHKMLEEGVYLPPSNFESYFLSSSHSGEDVEKTIRAVGAAMKKI